MDWGGQWRLVMVRMDQNAMTAGDLSENKDVELLQKLAAHPRPLAHFIYLDTKRGLSTWLGDRLRASCELPLLFRLHPW